jgi:chloride channel protein, CIC family
MQRHIKQWLRRIPKPAARWTRMLGLASIVGIVGGLAATGVEWGLHHGTAMLVGRYAQPAGAALFLFDWRVLLLPVVGGLASGILVQLIFREPFGHGTDILTRAFHHQMGDLRLKGPAVKAVAAVGVISTGGSTGPEGPIAALGAALGSAIAKLFSVTPRERRILLVAGCAAGIGAIFRCPLGGALFAAGVLYREPEFESEAIVPSFVASVLGYSTFMAFQPTFGEPLLGFANVLRFENPLELLAYAVLGPLCGVTAIFLTICLRTVERRIRPRIRLPIWMLPALGGLVTGGLACLLPQVMDPLYQFPRNVMEGLIFYEVQTSMWWWAMFFGAIVVVKCIATGFTVGSGASGGVLGPSVFIGGVVGAFLGALLQAALPGGIPENLRQALVPVGMAGVLAAGMRTPLAAMIMAAEMTGGYGLIVPLMLVCVSAYVVGRRWGLNPEQVRSAADSPAHAADGIIHYLESWHVEDLMEPDWSPVVGPEANLREMIQKIEPGTRPVFAVVKNGTLVGVISVPDIQRIMDEPGLAEAVIAEDMMTERLATLAPDDDIYQALSEFGRTQHNVLPVVSKDRDHRWLGMLTRRRVFETLQRRIGETQEQVLREHMGLRAIDTEGQIQQLVMAVSPVETDRIQRLMVPIDAVGKTIREAQMRQNYGLQVIGIEMPDGTLQFPPDLDLTLQAGHRLVATIVESAPATSGTESGPGE